MGLSLGGIVRRLSDVGTLSTVLLTGATGFVGRNLYGRLRSAGYAVRCVSRDPERARRREPDREWVGADVGDEESIARALEGCDFAYYLVHGMAEGGDFRRRETLAAKRFAERAAAASVKRIVYLGGIEPQGPASEHLRSRLEVGDALSSGPVTTLELRASMIIGYGSLSWLVVRDLAARLPSMILPRWLHSRTEPVGLDDVLVGLVRGLSIELQGSASFDLPGPEIMTGREILERTAKVLGRREPMVVELPMLGPWLSSQWLRFVTRADFRVAREIVVSLSDDVLSRDDRYWQLIGHTRRETFEEAAQKALAEEAAQGEVPGTWGRIERGLDKLWHPRA